MRRVGGFKARRPRFTMDRIGAFTVIALYMPPVFNSYQRITKRRITKRFGLRTDESGGYFRFDYTQGISGCSRDTEFIYLRPRPIDQSDPGSRTKGKVIRRRRGETIRNRGGRVMRQYVIFRLERFFKARNGKADPGIRIVERLLLGMQMGADLLFGSG